MKIMRDRENIQKNTQSSLHSLVTQTLQVGIGFGAMLAATGGRPSPPAIALTSAGSIAFVAVTEARRLNTERKRLEQNPPSKIEIEN